MTITLAQNAARVSYSVSEGATQTSFTVSFEFFDAADLNVYVDGTLKTISTHYTVSGGSGSTGAVAISVTGASGGSTVVITRSIALARTTDFPTSGSFQIATLNTELDRFTAIAADLKDSVDRGLILSDSDSSVSTTLPLLASRKGTVLGFNASTGAVEAGPSITAVQTLSAASASINLLGTAAVVEDMGLLSASAVIEDMGLLGTAAVIEDMGLLATSAVIEDMGLLATSTVIEDMGLLGTSANVTAMGLLGNSTVITNISNLSASAVIADMAILGTSDIVADMNTLATSDIVADMNLLATSAVIEDMGLLATSAVIEDMGLLATSTVIEDMGLLATSAVIEDMGLLATSAVIEDMGLLATSAVISDMSTLAGSGSTPTVTSIGVSSNATFADNSKAIFGAGSDLQIYHDGSDSIIADVGTGNLSIQGTNLRLRNADNTADYITCNNGGDVKLKYANANKLATTNTGIDVTGTITADGLTVDGNGSFSGTDTYLAFIETDLTNQSTRLRQTGGSLYIQKANNSGGFVQNMAQFATNGDISFYEDTGNTAKLFWDASAESLGIGTSSPSKKLHLSAADVSMYLDNTNANGQAWEFKSTNGSSSSTGTLQLKDEDGHSWMTFNENAGSNFTRFFTNNTERMRIDSSGNLLVGTTSADPSGSGSSGRIVINTKNGGQAALTCYNVGTSAVNIISLENGNGQVGRIQINGTATSYLTSSDYRLKEDWQLMSGASDRVLALKPVNFAWKVDGSRVDGFLAHEVAEVVPEAIAGTKDAMRDEEYQVSAATGDIYTAGVEAGFNEVSAAIEASPAYYDVDGNIIKAEVIAQAAVHEAYDAVDEVIHSADVEQPETLADGQQWRETTAAVMGTRSVPDMQGIDQSKLVPLLVASLQEALARITALENA